MPIALQDFVLTEHPAFVGLISMVTGSTLQEDIAAVGRRLLLRGRNILGLQKPGNKSQPTMIQKRLLRPERLRQVPPSFNWVDHRLVRHDYLDRCDAPRLALYLFLVTVADAQGLSYYSDASPCRQLKMDPLQLSAARAAWNRPI